MRPADVKPFDDMHEDRNGHQHADSECWDCADCSHPQCWHGDDHTAVEGVGMCDKPGCVCLEGVLNDGERNRCARCRGYGEIAVEPVSRDPQELHLTPCPVCGGSGDALPQAVAS